MSIKKITAAIAAAALAASVSICAFAEDISTEGAPFEWTVENAQIASAYQDEAKASVKYHGGVYDDTAYFDDVIDGILTDDVFIAINDGTETITDGMYANFVFCNFSEDGSTLERQEDCSVHSYFGEHNLFWDLTGQSQVPNENIDGIDVNICEAHNAVTVLGNRISGGLIRRIYEDYATVTSADADGPGHLCQPFDDFDYIEVQVSYTASDGEKMTAWVSFLTESYAKAHPVATKPDDPAEGTYKVTADKPFTDEEFAAILEENKTKDVEITVDGVTYTFKKGEMEAVEGAVYDFGATVTTDFSKLTDPDKALNEDNFVLHIDYNYSGKLPATASIKLYVGKEYAGKTLYYSQVLPEGCKFVQSAVVDDDGYITVTQDHCSDYVLTTEDVSKTSGGASADNDSASAASTDITSTADSTGKENPDTGMSGLTVTIGAMALAGAVIFTASRKRK